MTKSPKSRSNLAVLAPILTLVGIGLAGAFAAVFPWSLAMLYLSILPFPLVLLWVGRNAPSADQVIAEADAARSKHR